MSTDRLSLLCLSRDNLAARLDAASDRDVSALVRMLADVLVQIEAVEKATAPVKGTPLDDLRARRRGRSADAGSGARSAS